LTSVSFVSGSGNKILGWYAPPSNKAAIILAHGTNADRTALLPELRFLTAAGFGVLSIDWPGDGGSEGEVHWDQHERNALTSAVDWLLTRDDVDPSKIGAFGFSMGGYITAQVASYDRRISAVALAAAPTDFAEYTQWDNRAWGWLSEFPAMQAVRAAKMPLTELRAIDVVQKISPRPLLIIGGDADATIPEWMTRKLFAAAGEPKSLWIAHGAGHGNYSITAPDAYKAQVLEFFSRNLAPMNAPE
jgi:dipeptidyl aminopeptidase/acylaminoacyl peptidase